MIRRPHPYANLNAEELATTHHALRMLAIFPDLAADRVAEATRLADIAWEESCRRASRQRRKHSLEAHIVYGCAVVAVIIFVANLVLAAR